MRWPSACMNKTAFYNIGVNGYNMGRMKAFSYTYTSKVGELTTFLENSIINYYTDLKVDEIGRVELVMGLHVFID